MPSVTRLPSLGPRGEGWVVLQIVLLGAIAAAGWWLGPHWTWPLRALTTIVGVGAILAGMAQAALGLRHLGDALTPLPHPRGEADLVETGVYRRVRHPIYGGLIVAAFGWTLVSASLVALVLAAVLWAFFFLKSSREEAWLVDHYPGYAAYRMRTRRFIPWFG
jgi:protein-S-isoprenylcysteine O-methyltransferase Ste14